MALFKDVLLNTNMIREQDLLSIISMIELSKLISYCSEFVANNMSNFQ